MLYVGNKQKYAAKIARAINKALSEDFKNAIAEYYEPFLGGNNIIFDLQKELNIQPYNIVFNDINDEIITINKEILKFKDNREFFNYHFGNIEYFNFLWLFELEAFNGTDLINDYKIFMETFRHNKDLQDNIKEAYVDNNCSKEKYNQFLKDESIPHWKKLFVASFYNISGLVYYKKTYINQPVTDYSGGMVKLISGFKSLLLWMNQVRDLAFYTDAKINFFNEDYSNILNKYCIKTRPFIYKLIYLDPPYQNMDKTGAYNFVGDKIAFFNNVEKLAEDEFCEVFLSEQAELPPEKWEKILTFNIRVNNLVSRNEFLYKLKKHSTVKDNENDNKF